MAQSTIKGPNFSPKQTRSGFEGEAIFEQNPYDVPYEKIKVLPEVPQKRFHSQVRGGSPCIIRTPLGSDSEVDISSDNIHNSSLKKHPKDLNKHINKSLSTNKGEKQASKIKSEFI